MGILLACAGFTARWAYKTAEAFAGRRSGCFDHWKRIVVEGREDGYLRSLGLPPPDDRDEPQRRPGVHTDEAWNAD